MHRSYACLEVQYELLEVLHDASSVVLGEVSSSFILRVGIERSESSWCVCGWQIQSIACHAAVLDGRCELSSARLMSVGLREMGAGRTWTTKIQFSYHTRQSFSQSCYNDNDPLLYCILHFTIATLFSSNPPNQ